MTALDAEPAGRLLPLPAVLAVVGSRRAGREAAADGPWDEVTRRTHQALRQIHEERTR